MQLVVRALLVLAVLVAPAVAGEAPTLTDDQRARIQNYELRIENAVLKIAALQAEAARAQAEATAYLASLAREGYTLQPLGGAWAYVPKEPAK